MQNDVFVVHVPDKTCKRIAILALGLSIFNAIMLKRFADHMYDKVEEIEEVRKGE